jgi:hypothetical protein
LSIIARKIRESFVKLTAGFVAADVVVAGEGLRDFVAEGDGSDVILGRVHEVVGQTSATE